MFSRIAALRRTVPFATALHHTRHKLLLQTWRTYTSRNILKLEERGLWADFFPDSKYVTYLLLFIHSSLYSKTKKSNHCFYDLHYINKISLIRLVVHDGEILGVLLMVWLDVSS